MILFLLGMGCGPGVNLSGDWRGELSCGQNAYAFDWGPVDRVGGLWQGAGELDYGDSNLGERILAFELEVDVVRNTLETTMRDCDLAYAGEVEVSACLAVDLTYDTDLPDDLSGTVDGCPLQLLR